MRKSLPHSIGGAALAEKGWYSYGDRDGFTFAPPFFAPSCPMLPLSAWQEKVKQSKLGRFKRLSRRRYSCAVSSLAASLCRIIFSLPKSQVGTTT
jgi:hypothetical protein